MTQQTTFLATERDAAAILRMSVCTLRNWRAKRIGPPYLKLGKRAVRYRREDLDSFIAAGERDTGTPR